MADEISPIMKQSTGEDSTWFAKSEIITVLVGPDKEEYHLHASILNRCPFFKSCLQSGMLEQEEKIVSLPEDNPEAFGIVTSWLYTERIPFDGKPRDLMSAYVLADKLCMGILQDALMNKLQNDLKQEIPIDPADVGWVWDNTGEGSKLRTFMVDALHDSVTVSNKYLNNACDTSNPLAAKLESLMSSNGALGYHLYLKFINDDGLRAQASNKYAPPYHRSCKYHVHGAEKVCKPH